MPCCTRDETKRQPVVIITNGRWKGERAVLHWPSRSHKTWRVRLLDQTKPFEERFTYSQAGYVDSVSSNQIIRWISPLDFQKTNETALPEYNTWHTDTRRLLGKFHGKSRAFVNRHKPSDKK